MCYLGRIWYIQKIHIKSTHVLYQANMVHAFSSTCNWNAVQKNDFIKKIYFENLIDTLLSLQHTKLPKLSTLKKLSLLINNFLLYQYIFFMNTSELSCYWFMQWIMVALTYSNDLTYDGNLFSWEILLTQILET